jgi:hypothetical protein
MLEEAEQPSAVMLSPAAAALAKRRSSMHGSLDGALAVSAAASGSGAAGKAGSSAAAAAQSVATGPSQGSSTASPNLSKAEVRLPVCVVHSACECACC